MENEQATTLVDSMGSVTTQFEGSPIYVKLLVLVVMLAIIVAAFFLAKHLGLWLVRRMETKDWAGRRGLRIQKQQILSGKDIARVYTGIIRASAWLFFGGFALYTISGILHLFPRTQPIAELIFGGTWNTITGMWTAFIEYIPSLITVIVILVVMRFVVRILKLVFDGLASKRISIIGFYPEWAHTSFNLIRILLYALTIVIIFPYLPGSGSPAFQGVSIFLGVLFSLGSTAAIANIVAGIVLTYTRAFKPGDFVSIDNTEGSIIERGMFVTQIKTRKNEVVSIPNASVLGSHIINFSTQAETTGLLLYTEITIGYDVPWEQVEGLLKEAASRTDNIESDPEPFVLQTNLNDFYVHYELNAITRNPLAMPSTYSALHMNIQNTFAEAGVEIMSPHFRGEREASTPAIPSLPANPKTGG